MTLSSPMLACPLLKPTDPHTYESILLAMKKLKKWPVLASLKMDGVRALRMEGPILASRTFKWIPNDSLNARALASLPIGCDMELWSPSLDYNNIQSLVMTEDADASKIEFHIFDIWDSTGAWLYVQRLNVLKGYDLFRGSTIAKFQEPMWCHTPEELFALFVKYELENGEGICFRTWDSPYKQGRSTLREQYLIKLCRYVFSEVMITGFTEQMENTNSKKRNAVGKMDRSKSLSGMVEKNTLGAFQVVNDAGVKFDVGTGTGMTDAFRKAVWDNKEAWLGKRITIRSKAHGVKLKPRSPTYWGERREGY